MNEKAKSRIKHRRRSGKPPQKLITLLLTLGWCGMGIGAILMIWGVFQLKKNYFTELITCGLWFFVSGMLLLLIGSLLNRLRHPDRYAKPEFKPVSKHHRRRRRRRTPNAEHENNATP